MYAEDAPLWRRYEQACDFLEEDLESGYVRVLQEMIAAGWSTPEIGDRARTMLAGWYELLTEVATEARRPVRWPRSVHRRPKPPRSSATPSIGAEELLLLGFDRHHDADPSAPRRVGDLIRASRSVRESESASLERRAAYAERDGVKLHWEVFGAGRHDDRAAADVVDHSARDTGKRRFRTSPGTSASSRSTAEAAVIPTGRRADAYTPRRVRRRHGRRARRHRNARGRVGRVLCGACGV